MVFSMNANETAHQIKPKSRTSAEYVRRIRMAIDYIEKNIDKRLQLDDVAQASHFSSYHFHRIFHALVGETVNDYISRKRMEMAITRVVYQPDLNITDVASLGGFSSSANFAKSFKLYFGISATELRKGVIADSPNQVKEDNNGKIGKIFSKYGKVFKPKDLYSQVVTHSEVFDLHKLEESLMSIKVEEIEEKRTAYISAPGGYELESVYATWDKIIHWAEINGIDAAANKRFAICHDNPLITPENKCRYDAAIEIESNVEVNQPFTESTLPGGQYAVAYYKDNADKISSFMTEICSQWFPESGFEPDNYPPIFNYLNDSREDGYVEMDIYIKIKKLTFSH